MRMNDASGRVLVLANLGTPAAPTATAVSAYLDEFLSDPRVVQLPRWLWRPLLRHAILPRRSPVVAKKYASIWMDGGSPLAVHTQALAQAVQARLPQWKVVHAMRYGTPSLAEVLRNAIAGGARELRVLPLYPQYSTTTTASVADAIAAAGAGEARIGMLDDYHRHPAWIRAVADSIRAHWQAQGRGERLLLSFHGLPQRVVDAGDPYAAQCEASAAEIARELGLERGDIELAYQSRFGKGRWLQPSTDARLLALAAQGVRTIDVACPGFAVDCLETLEEIAQLEAERFRAAGGGSLRVIPCLNAAPAHADAIAAIAEDTWN
jgi:ferrochelatase